MGSLSILNVGAGDTKLTFDNSNPAEAIRAARIVKDMLRRGYALLVEVERGGQKAYERALEFREGTAEYIIADFDPVQAEAADKQENSNHKEINGESGQDEAGNQDCEAGNPAATGESGKKRGRRRGVPASSTRAVAVARSAGG